MKRNIFDCWNCRHHNSNNPYGIDYCDVHDTRCSFACGNCDNFEPDTNTDDNDGHPQPSCRLTVIGWYLLAIAVAALLGWMLMGCTTTEYVTTVEHKTDSVYITQHLRDSIYVHDSTLVKEKGDTLLIERWHTAWRDRAVHDTTAVVRIDSVPVPYPVIKKVPAELTWWQKIRLEATNILIFFILIFFIIVIGKRHLKKLMS